jgi:hypothetical protein
MFLLLSLTVFFISIFSTYFADFSLCHFLPPHIWNRLVCFASDAPRRSSLWSSTRLLSLDCASELAFFSKQRGTHIWNWLVCFTSDAPKKSSLWSLTQFLSLDCVLELAFFFLSEEKQWQWLLEAFIVYHRLST